MALLPATPGEGMWIGPAGGQNHFNVGIGQGTSGASGGHTDFTQAQIVNGYADPNKFYLNSTGNTVFRINASAGTTSTNTVHPRSELRELLANGTTLAAWDGRTGAHYMKGRSRLIAVTTNRPWICFAQIHGSPGSPESSDLVRIQTEGAIGATTGLEIVCRRSPPSGGSEIRTVLRTGYSVNTWMNWELRIDAGRLRFILDGVTVLDVTGMGQIGNYFKTGCYLQDNVDKGAGSGDWGAVEMERGSLETWHTGYPAPTTPIFTGADDGLGGGTDTQPPTIPQGLSGLRGDTAATLQWAASTDNVGVVNYVVRRGSAGSGSTTTAQTGKTSNGAGQSSSTAARTTVSAAVGASTGTLIAGHARLWVDTGTAANVRMVVYADSGGAPAALLATSDSLTLSNLSEALIDFTFSGGQQITMTTGVTYWIGFCWTDPGSNNIFWSRDATASQTAQNTSSLPANPFGSVTSLSGPIDAYVDVQTVISGPTQVGTPTSTTFSDSGLTNAVAYTYTVSAKDAAGNESAQSDPVVITPGPPDLVAPTVPTGLATLPGDRRVTVSWTASTDADTGVKGYVVYRDGVAVGSPTATSFVDTELNNGITYAYTVAAVDNSDNASAQTSPVNGTPTAPPVAGVPFLERELGRGARLTVEVAFGANPNSDPTGWTWVDVTADMRQDPGISTSLGRNDESSTSNPAELTIVLTNTTGDYSIGGRSRRWPYVRRNTPVRLRIDPADRGGGRVVFQGGANGWTPSWDSLTGKIPVVTLSASGTLRRLTQGDAPIVSAIRRAMTPLASVVSYWPMEEGEAATYAPAIKGGGNMEVIGTPDWSADSTFFCSDRLPRLKDGQLTAYPSPYTVTGKTQVRFLILLPEDLADVPAGAYLCSVFGTGSIARWDIVWGPADYEAPALALYAYNADGSLNSFDVGGFGINGKPGRMSLELTESGGSIAWRLGYTDAVVGSTAGYITGSISSRTVGAVSWIQFGATRDLKDTIVGHLTLETSITSLFTATDALIGFQGEPATSSATNPYRSRIERLCSENGLSLTRYTGSASIPNDRLAGFDTMGPQLVNPLLTLLREAEEADQGQLWDGRSNGLSYTTRRRREEGAVRIVIDAAAGQLAGNFRPVDDDQRTRNRVEVKRSFGITQVYEDVYGPMGTDAIGYYDDSATVNLGLDETVIQHAQWRVSLGTVTGMRYPSVSIDLRAAPQLAAAVLDLVPGERIDVINVDDVLSGFSADRVSLIVEGIGHDITATTWEATFRCSPFEPWAIGRIAQDTGDTSDMCMRLDTDGSTLAATVGPKATALVVATTGTNAPWTTVADDYPFTLSVGGLPVRVTACAGASSPQTFTCDPLIVGLAAGVPVELWEPRRLGMGFSAP